MGPVTIIETKTFETIINSMIALENKVSNMYEELKESKSTYLTVKEAASYMRVNASWLYAHKADVGYSCPEGKIVFTRKKIDEYLEKSFYQRS